MPRTPRDPSSDRTASHAPAVEIEICDTQGVIEIDALRLERLARGVLAGEGVRLASISIALVDNPTIHQMNRRHLGHDWPTDVITFPLSNPGDSVLAGELVVSTEMARDTALAIGADPADELALYVVHGLLHLCGYDDATDSDSLRMRDRESAALAREGLPNTFPLVERSATSGTG